jgi:hypothetical protein
MVRQKNGSELDLIIFSKIAILLVDNATTFPNFVKFFINLLLSHTTDRIFCEKFQDYEFAGFYEKIQVVTKTLRNVRKIARKNPSKE